MACVVFATGRACFTAVPRRSGQVALPVAGLRHDSLNMQLVAASNQSKSVGIRLPTHFSTPLSLTPSLRALVTASMGTSPTFSGPWRAVGVSLAETIPFTSVATFAKVVSGAGGGNLQGSWTSFLPRMGRMLAGSLAWTRLDGWHVKD